MLPQWTLLSLRASSAHGCAAARVVIIFTSLVSFPSIQLHFTLSHCLTSPFLLTFLPFLMALHHLQKLEQLFDFLLLTAFLQSHSHPLLPPSLSDLADLNACIMHGEGKTVGRPASANNTKRKQDSGGKKKNTKPPFGQDCYTKTVRQYTDSKATVPS